MQQDISAVVDGVKGLQKSGASTAQQWDYIKQAGYSPAEYVSAKNQAQASDAAPARSAEPAASLPVKVLSALENGALLGAGPKVSGFLDYLLQKTGIPGGRVTTDPSLAAHIAANAGSEASFASDHPLASEALNAGGALASTAAPIGGLLGPALQGSGKVMSALKAATAAGGVGAVSGAVSAPPDQSALVGAARGALTGAATGLLAAPLIGGATNALGAASDALAGPIARLRTYTGAKLDIPEPAPVAPAPMPSGPPQSPTGPAPAPEPPPGPAPSPGAVGTILDQLNRDSLTPSGLRAKLQDSFSLGKPQSVAAVSQPGGNVQQRGKTAFLLPGPGKSVAGDALDSSVSGMPARVTSDLSEMTGAPNMDTQAAQASLEAKRTALAKPAYEKAYAQGELNDEDLNNLLQDNPAYADAHTNAMRVINRSSPTSEQVPPLFEPARIPNPDKPGMTMVNPNAGSLMRNPTVQDIDVIKKGMDSKIYGASGAAMDTATAFEKMGLNPLGKARTAMMDAVDPLAPDYAKARQQFGDSVELEHAFEDGRALIMRGDSASPNDAKQTLASLSDAGKQAFRLGVQDAMSRGVMSKADTSPAGTATQLVGSGEGTKMQMIRAVFGDTPAADRLLAQMKAEQARQQTRNFTMGGSATAANAAGIMDSVGDIASEAAHGPKAVAKGIVSRGWDTLSNAINSEHNRAVASELYRQRSGAQTDQFLRALDDLAAKRAARKSGNTAGLSLLTGASGNQGQ
jgi:hypothetical protein